MYWCVPFIGDPQRVVQVVWWLIVMIVKNMLRAMPRWQVAQMWLGDLVSHPVAEALWCSCILMRSGAVTLQH